MKKLLISLMQEEVRNIIDMKGANGLNMPKVIFNVLCSQACHGKPNVKLSVASC